MSRETLLDDAIAKAKKAEDRQLVEWLRTARGSVSAARWYTEKLRDLEQTKAENAKLREELEQWHRLTAGIELPEYPITEFKPKDLERENTKLRELVRDMWTWQDALPYERHTEIRNRMRELGIEVDE